MDYEQKYKAALGWMQGLYNGLHGKTKEEAEKFFPELAESEDEKIRKELINIINLSYDCGIAITKENYKKYIAWLEKQGESYTWTEEDEIGYDDTLFAIEKARLVAKDENDMGNLWYAERWLKSLKGNKK